MGKVHFASSQGVRYHNLIKYMKNDFEVVVLSLYTEFFSQHDNIIKVLNGNRNVLKKLLKWVYKRSIEKYIFPDKFIFKIKQYEVLIKKALETGSYDYVIIGMTPFSLYKTASFIRSMDSKIKIVCDLSDPFTNNGIIKYWFPSWGKIVKAYEEKHLASVNAIVVLNPFIKSLYERSYETFSANDIYVIEQGLSSEFLKYSNLNKDFNDDTRKIKMLYAGGLYYKLREPFELYKAIENIQNNEISLDIYGNISTSLLPKNSRKIFYLGVLTQSQLIEKYMQSQLLIFIDNAFGYQVPGKLLEMISLKKPILFIYSNNNSPSLHYIKKSSNVFLVKNEAGVIQKEIIKILNTKSNSIEGTDVVEFTWNKLAKKYKVILEQ